MNIVEPILPTLVNPTLCCKWPLLQDYYILASQIKQKLYKDFFFFILEVEGQSDLKISHVTL